MEDELYTKVYWNAYDIGFNGWDKNNPYEDGSDEYYQYEHGWNDGVETLIDIAGPYGN